MKSKSKLSWFAALGYYLIVSNFFLLFSPLLFCFYLLFWDFLFRGFWVGLLSLISLLLLDYLLFFFIKYFGSVPAGFTYALTNLQETIFTKSLIACPKVLYIKPRCLIRFAASSYAIFSRFLLKLYYPYTFSYGLSSRIESNIYLS
jgi:hypothetical protein